MTSMLTLVSNPYDPFTEYDDWRKFDIHEGFDTAGLLARTISTSSDYFDADQEQAQIDAIDSIVNNPSFAGLYKRVDRVD